MSPHRSSRFASQRGLSLLELLVAMFIGLFLVGGVTAIFLVSKRGYTETENVSRANESARFGLYLLANNIAHIGFFGGANPSPPSFVNSLTAITGDCTGTASMVDLVNHFRVVKATSASLVGCITDAQTDSDVLIIKSVRPVPFFDGALDDPDDNDGTVDTPEALTPSRVYLWASRLGVESQLFRGNVQPDLTRIADGVAWEYLGHIYYVRNVAGREPTLSRKVLRWNGTALAVDTEDLVEGVERLRILPGVLTGTYLAPQVKYMETTEIPAASADWRSVASVQLRMLVRSADIDPGGVGRNLRYVLVEGTEAGYDFLEPGANDRRYRTVVQETINVRNFAYP